MWDKQKLIEETGASIDRSPVKEEQQSVV